MLTAVLIYAAAVATVGAVMVGMVAFLLSVALYTDWRDEARA